ncbi:hypothetical protein EJB05_03651, partial [Eragrostis curvula]
MGFKIDPNNNSSRFVSIAKRSEADLSLRLAHGSTQPASAPPSPSPGRRNPRRRRRFSRAAGMSSSRKNFRRRADDDDETNGDGGSRPPTTASKTQTVTVPKSKSPPRRQAASRLSFADDEDEDDAEEGPFANRRRPTASVRPARTASPAAAALHRLTPAKERIKSSPASVAAVSAPKPSNFQSHAGEYTPERLRELQKNARPLPGSLLRAPGGLQPLILGLRSWLEHLLVQLLLQLPQLLQNQWLFLRVW